ncbi:hypothetical protein ACP70R_012061 [Stipagrostis hirtigluma subsp. patula]
MKISHVFASVGVRPEEARGDHGDGRGVRVRLRRPPPRRGERRRPHRPLRHLRVRHTLRRPIRGFSSEGYLDGKHGRRLDDCQRYAIIAAKKALVAAALAPGSSAIRKIDKEHAGVVVGSGAGYVGEFAAGAEALAMKGPGKISPFSVPLATPNAASTLVTADASIGFLGPNYSVSAACATSNHCLHRAADQIRLGRADVMVAGDAEAAIMPAGLGGFAACRALSRRNGDPGRRCGRGTWTAMASSWARAPLDMSLVESCKDAGVDFRIFGLDLDFGKVMIKGNTYGNVKLIFWIWRMRAGSCERRTRVGADARQGVCRLLLILFSSRDKQSGHQTDVCTLYNITTYS